MYCYGVHVKVRELMGLVFFPSTVGVSSIEIGLSDLAASVFTHQSISLALH